MIFKLAKKCHCNLLDFSLWMAPLSNCISWFREKGNLDFMNTLVTFLTKFDNSTFSIRISKTLCKIIRTTSNLLLYLPLVVPTIKPNLLHNFSTHSTFMYVVVLHIVFIFCLYHFSLFYQRKYLKSLLIIT